jgi:uncharacterized membrane protein YccC
LPYDVIKRASYLMRFTLLLVTLALWMTGCARNQHEEVRALELHEADSSAREASERRREFETKASDRLRYYDDRSSELQAALRQSSPGAVPSEAIKRQMEEFDRLRASSRLKFDEMKSSADRDWENLRRDVDADGERLQHSWEVLSSELRNPKP